MTKSEIMSIAKSQKSFPQNLFKYRAHNDFTEKIITDNEMWFSNPLEFNDPYDCNTPITASSSKSEIEQWANNIGIYPENIANIVSMLQKNPNIVKEKTENAMKNSAVCCFSTLYDSILQWSHYSDYHKGICLKFDIYEDSEFFMTPIIVAYRKVMQHYNHFLHSEKMIEYLIQPKHTDWSYESEVRIVKTEKGLRENGRKRTFKYKDSALKEIIFGSKASDKTIEYYKNLCKTNNKKHVEFSKMELGNGTNYELIKKPI